MSNATANRERTNLQSIAIEYRTTGALDGATVAPPISVDPTERDFVEPDPLDHIYRYPGILSQNIGLIDLSLVGIATGCRADRYVKAFFAAGVGTGVKFGAESELFIGDNVFAEFGQPPAVMQQVEIIAVGREAIFREICVTVPQGSMIGIKNLGSPVNPGTYNLIRIQILNPWTVWSAPLLEQACCCEQEPKG